MESGTRMSDRSLILEAAFQVCDSSLNTDSLFDEACSLSKKFKENKVEGVSLDELLSRTLSHVYKSGGSLSSHCMLSTPWIAKQVKCLAVQCDSSSPLYPDSLKEQWKACLCLLRDSIQQNIFLPHLFSSLLAQHNLPIELVWNLHVIGAFDLQKYFTSKMVDTPACQKLADRLLQLCQGTGEDKSRRKDILSGVLCFVLTKAFAESNSTLDTRVYIKVVDCFVAGFLDTQIESEEGSISPFDEVVTSQATDASRRKFSLHVLSNCLQHCTNTKISESLGIVHTYESSPSRRKLISFLKHLMIRLEKKDICEMLMRCHDCDLVNTHMTLGFAEAFLSLEEKNGSFLKERIHSMLCGGLQSADDHQTALAFFLARQVCSLQNRNFPSYRDWFKRTFDDATSPAANRVSFSFLMKCLRDWVPQESAEYLKTHILKRPFIPARMKDAYDSYVLLAKTRLSDLQVSVNDLWLEKASQGSHQAKGNQSNHSDPLVNDVEQAVQSYGETGKVPTFILEASIFRRPYFVGKFLPELLKPRFLPDVADTKMKLIDELFKSGRMAASLHNAYLDNCHKERQALLDGVFDLDDDEAEDEMILQPIEQLQFQLDLLTKAVLSGDTQRVNEKVSLVKERISTLLPDANMKMEEPYVIQVVLNASIGNTEEQIILIILQSLSQAFSVLGKRSELRRGLIHNSWLLDLLRNVIFDFSTLQSALVTFVVTWVNKKTTPKDVSIESLSMVCLSLRCLLASVNFELYTGKDTESPCPKSYTDIAMLICDCLSHHSSEDRHFSLRFLATYVIEVLQYFKDLKSHNEGNDSLVELLEPMVPLEHLLQSSLLKQVRLVYWRCVSEFKSSGRGEELRTLFPGLEKCFKMFESEASWGNISREGKPSLVDWLEFELRIDSHTDGLAVSQRHSYHWEKTGEYLYEMGTSLVCSQMFVVLAENRPSISKSTSVSSQETIWMEVMTLLKKLLLQLPSSGNETPWLLSTLNSSTANQKSSLLRLISTLQPFLLLRNSTHEDLGENCVKSAMAILDLLSTSNLNEGGYLNLDMTISVAQACSVEQHSTKETGVGLIRLLSHPLVFSSMLVHKDSLDHLGILKRLPKEWLSLQGLAVGIDESVHCPDGTVCQEWMKAAGVFSSVLNWPSEKTLPRSIMNRLSHECQVYLMEYIAIFYCFNLQILEKPHTMKSIFHLMIQNSPQLIEEFFSCRIFQSKVTQWRNDLGVHRTSIHLRMFCFMRLCSEIPVRQLATLTGRGIGCLVSAHVNLLQFALQDIEVLSKMSLEDLNVLSSWLKRLTDESCVPSISGVDFNALRKWDPLLYRHVCLRFGRR